MDLAAAGATRRKLDVHDYHRMGDAGIFRPGERVELIEGELVDMAPIGQLHSGIVNGLTEVFVLACAGRAVVSPQGPLRLDGYNEVQPDLLILRRRADFYTAKMPEPADVLLLVEVADSSLRFDRTVKLPLYAKAGIPEFGLLDAKRRTVDVHREPDGTTFRAMLTRGPGDALALAAAPDIAVRLDAVFGAMV